MIAQNKMKGLFYFTMHTPIIYTLGIVLYCALLLNGIDNRLLKSCIAVSPLGAIVFFFLSRWLSFCWIHSAMIIHAFVSNVCMLFREVHIIHAIVTTKIFRICILTTGAALLLLTICKITKAIYEGKKSLSFYCPHAYRFIQ